MCIHMRHSDIHLGHVIYFMGVFWVMDIFISLLDYDQFRQVASFYHASIPADIYDQKPNPC